MNQLRQNIFNNLERSDLVRVLKTCILPALCMEKYENVYFSPQAPAYPIFNSKHFTYRNQLSTKPRINLLAYVQHNFIRNLFVTICMCKYILYLQSIIIANANIITSPPRLLVVAIRIVLSSLSSRKKKPSLFFDVNVEVK
jgi:hypothetical protein